MILIAWVLYLIREVRYHKAIKETLMVSHKTLMDSHVELSREFNDYLYDQLKK